MKRVFPLLLVLTLVGLACQPQDLLDPPVGGRTGSAHPVFSVPRSIDSTGRTDVSRQFSDFVASVPDGAVVKLARNGTYRMEQTLYIDQRHDLTFDGNSATIVATTQGDRNRANIRVRGGSNITFRNLTVKGANPHGGKNGPDPWRADWEAQHAFDGLGVRGLELVEVVATDTHGDFVHLSKWRGRWSDDVVIRDSRFARSGRQGIALVAVRNVLIEDNELTDMRRATFDFEPDNAPGNGVEHVVVRNNRIGPGRLMFVAAAGHGPVNDVTIEGNELSGQALQVFLIDKSGGRRSDWRIVNNTSDLPLNNPHRSAMRIWRVDGLEIRGNRQPFTKGGRMYGANIDKSCDVVVRGNHYANAVGQANITRGC